ncbi:larval cuticle protein A2B-like [Ischnura elegans]|uniref:larval cuticle protein A2B-like n=1 Tax=Ischnura elegans TaxID=197161 RepID=UPI001ED870FC|nr:larval cuticle protein A2B-like [Ischnura elegans]
MSLKLFVLAALVAAASAGYLGQRVSYAPIAYRTVYAKAAPAPAPAKAAPAPAEDDEVDPNPSYNYSYDVSDAETGDTKTQSQSLENGVVRGSYTVVDPDGIKRTVEYTADDVNGFNAVVNMEPSNIVIPQPKPKAAAPAQPAKVAAVYHAPTVTYHAAPVAKVYAAPVATKLVSAPHSYSTSHFSYQPSVAVAAPAYKKFVYA